MRRDLAVLLAAAALVIPSGAALADPGQNNPRPENPPCDADHGHPQENSAQCDGDDEGNGNGDGNGGDAGDGNGNGDDATGAANRCTAEDSDTAGLSGDTIAQQVADSELGALPVLTDPEAQGPVSEPVESIGDDTELDPVTNEVGCALSVTVAPL